MKSTTKLINKQSNAHSESIWTICWSKTNSNQLFSGSIDGTVYGWLMSEEGDLSVEKEFIGHQLGVINLLCTENDKLVSTSVDCIIRIFDIESEILEQKIDCGRVECWTICLNYNEELLATGTHTGHIMLHDFKPLKQGLNYTNARLPIALNGETKAFILCLCFQPVKQVEEKESYFLVAGDKSGNILWFSCTPNSGQDTDGDYKLISSEAKHLHAVRSVEFGGEGKLLFSAGDDMMIRIYDAPSRKEIISVPGHRSLITSLVPSRDIDSKYFLSISADKTLKVFETKTGAVLDCIDCESEELHQIKLNNKGDRICFGCDGDLFLYSLQTP
eukprot:maker-scaffold_1-snap-gene-24.18-mRNA-1 protein AED:0.01 eAED:0.01 QI:85/1/1/1/0.6/0.33/6/1365/330